MPGKLKTEADGIKKGTRKYETEKIFQDIERGQESFEREITNKAGYRHL